MTRRWRRCAPGPPATHSSGTPGVADLGATTRRKLSQDLHRSLAPRFYRRLDPATAGTVGGAFTAVLLGLFHTSLSQGADRLLVPNSVLLQLVVVPLREPAKVDLRARFSATPVRAEDGSQLAEQVLDALRDGTPAPITDGAGDAARREP